MPTQLDGPEGPDAPEAAGESERHKPSRPTLSDVAARAHVSVSTASLAFSGQGPIAEATRDRVREAASELGYRGPSPLGRQLRSGRSGIVGVVIGGHVSRTFRDPVAIKVLDGIMSELATHGLGVLLIPAVPGSDHGTDPLLESAAMDAIVLVWGVGSKDPTYEAVVRRGLPAVIGEGRRQPGVPVVALADRVGTAEIGRHLTELGHHKIAVVTLPFGLTERSGPVDGRRLRQVDRTPTKRRLAGVKDAGIVPTIIWETQASLVEHGHEAGTAILDVPASERPTAVIAQSDLLAAGVLLAAQELGIDVPAELSIAGFDGVDLPWLGEERLTSVRQPFTEKGAALGRAAVALAAGESVEDVELPVELVIGTTTGPVPTSA